MYELVNCHGEIILAVVGRNAALAAAEEYRAIFPGEVVMVVRV